MDDEFAKALIRSVPIKTPEETAEENAKRVAENEKRLKEQEEAIRLAVPRTIEELRKEAAQKLNEADKLEKLLRAFPNLRKQTGRWNKVAYYSKDVNSKVNRFDLRHSCGCCSDSVLEIWPFLETPDGDIYSDPPKFVVGEKHWIAGDRPYANWNKEMRSANIPEAIIDAVQMHFENGKQERLAMVQEEKYMVEEENETDL